MKRFVCSGLIALTLLAACSGIPKRESDSEALARFIDYAGAPVDRFTYLGRFTGWRALGRDKLVVWTGLNDAYLLTVGGACMDLQFANRIGVTSSGNSVSRGFDSVLLPRRQKCIITEIRPVDYKALRAEQRDAG
jgi:hypothetical protein